MLVRLGPKDLSYLRDAHCMGEVYAPPGRDPAGMT